MSALLASGARAFSQDNPLGQFDGHGDIGSPDIAGSASYDPAAQTYTLTGGGINMWSTNDQFHFLWKKMSGDFILRTRVEFVGKGVEEHRKVGWMARASLDSNAAYVDAVEHGVGLTSLQYRPDTGAKTAQLVLPITSADIIQFERRGTNFIFSAARNGEMFISTNYSGTTLPDDVFAGLFICSHNPKVKEEVIFHDVRIIRPAAPHRIAREPVPTMSTLAERLSIRPKVALERIESANSPSAIAKAAPAAATMRQCAPPRRKPTAVSAPSA